MISKLFTSILIVTSCLSAVAMEFDSSQLPEPTSRTNSRELTDPFDITVDKMKALAQAHVAFQKLVLDVEIETRDIDFFENMQNGNIQPYTIELDTLLANCKWCIANLKFYLDHHQKPFSKGKEWAIQDAINLCSWIIQKLSPYQYGSFDYVNLSFLKHPLKNVITMEDDKPMFPKQSAVDLFSTKLRIDYPMQYKKILDGSGADQNKINEILSRFQSEVSLTISKIKKSYTPTSCPFDEECQNLIFDFLTVSPHALCMKLGLTLRPMENFDSPWLVDLTPYTLMSNENTPLWEEVYRIAHPTGRLPNNHLPQEAPSTMTKKPSNAKKRPVKKNQKIPRKNHVALVHDAHSQKDQQSAHTDARSLNTTGNNEKEQQPAHTNASSLNTTNTKETNLPHLGPRLPNPLELKKISKVRRLECQRQARIASQELYERNLQGADLTNYTDLVSDFQWMADLANPSKTMTYQSIKGKLENFVSVKNGEGSRRHFVVYDTPSGKTVACYFHEPHPDEAVSIEKWRLSLVEQFKLAGYYTSSK